MKQHPTKAQVQLVIDNLYKAKKLANENCPVNMLETTVVFEHPCGTPMCHAGWYALATCKKGVNFNDGADIMGEHLGFKGEYELRQWAGNNAQIWGNIYGGSMFGSNRAFAKDFGEDTNLQDIITHWEGVRDRLPE